MGEMTREGASSSPGGVSQETGQMPVMGRFRLRRESRRAFLQSGLQSEVRSIRLRKTLRLSRSIAFAGKSNPPGSIGPLLKRAQFSISAGTPQISSPSSLRLLASADYFRGRSSTMRAIYCAGLALAFAFTSLAAIAESSNVHGTVTDPLGAVVPGAQVQLFRESKLVGSTTTDSEGKYRFSPLSPGRYRVKTQAPSFSQQQSDAIYIGSSSNAAVDITLKVGSVSQQIVVSATGTSLPETQTGASISVVTSDQFQYKPEVLEPLRSIPGVQVFENGQRGINESLFIRGGESKFNKVLLDGVPLNEIGGTVDFGGIFTTGIDQVEILRGPNSVLYGSDALAGVVNLTTTQGSTFTPQISYAFDAGNFNSLHNDLSLGGIFRQIDYFSEFARYDGGNTSSNPHFHNGTYAGNFGWTPGASTSLRLTVRRVAAKVDVPNAIDFFGIPDDSFQTEDNTYIGATLQNQTTAHWHNLLRYGATRQNSEFVNPSPTGTT